MCIAAVALNSHPRWALVVAANRDEYHAREAAPLAAWNDGSGITAGRDLVGGGTWLGLHEAGRLVLVTNFRVEGYPKPGRPSRGGLVTGLLQGDDPQGIDLTPYNPFNLLIAEMNGHATLLCNYPEAHRTNLPFGVLGLSNGAFTPAWPKTKRLCTNLKGWIEAGNDDPAPLFSALRDESPHDSPGDGLGLGPEPRLSGVFIHDATYGTRCSTVVAVDHSGYGRIIERRFDADGAVSGETALDFHWPSP